MEEYSVEGAGMAKINFTAARVDGHRCTEGKSQSFLWDSKAPGLGLRATSGGAKSYIFQGKIHGQTVRVTIGDPRSWTIDKAQEEARRLQRLVDDGKDPRVERSKQRAAHEAEQAEARRKDVTVAEAWSAYLGARKGKWSQRHYQDHMRLAEIGGRDVKRGEGQIVAGPLAELMPLRLSALTLDRADVWLEKETEKRPARARLAFSLLRAFIAWCEARAEYKGMASPEICSDRGIREHLPKAQTKIDCLQREQLPAWFCSVRKIGNPVISAYLQALLIAGSRREEMAALKWTDVDFRWGSLAIADKIEDAGRVIPLTPYLASLLLDLKRINETPPKVRALKRLEAKGEKWKPSPWVFASKAAADGKIAEPRTAHNQAMAAAGLPHLTLHGLRRSFGTLAEWCEVPVGVVAQIQGHKPSAIAEKHYRRRPLDLLRMWHDKIEAWMLKEAGIEFVPAKAEPKNLEAMSS
jgi:integrase